MKLLTNKTLKTFSILFLCLLFIETIFRIGSNYPIFDFAMIRIILGFVIVSSILSVLLSFCNDIIRNIITFVVIIFASVYAIAQAGFNTYLGTYMSFSTATQAGAISDFVGEFIGSIKFQYWLILIPLIVFIILFIIFDKKINTYESNLEISYIDKIRGKKKKEEEKERQAKLKKKKLLINRLVFLGVFVVSCGLYYVSLIVPFMQNELQMIDNISLYRNPSMPNIAISQFGVEGFCFLDVKALVLPYDEAAHAYKNKEREITINDEGVDLTRYIDDSEWISLNESETNKDYKTLNNYFMSKTITAKNEYTGKFKDKNLIVIMIESGSNVLFDYPEYFPNINKLRDEGWSWENAFSPRNACSTGNNEMSGITSLYTINRNCTANVYKDNTYFESMFNLFNEQNYNVTSYHDYDDHFYYRKTYHPNMGSQYFYNVDDLGVKRLGDLTNQPWPSDVDFVQKALPKFIDEEKYMAWLTTVSSHMKYMISSATGYMYLDLFKDQKWNIQAKRYMSKLKIVDLAIGELIDTLEKEGRLDDTIIAIYADHEPYGLDANIFQQIAKYNVLTAYQDVDRTPFIIYNPELTPTKHEEYTSFINLLPTLANLFDLDYDPRLYGGEDLLSDTYTNVVAFADGSWRSDIAFYNATKSEIKYLGDETYSAEQVKTINNKIKTEMEMDNLAIKKDYFTYLNKKLNKGFNPGKINISKKVSKEDKQVTKEGE